MDISMLSAHILHNRRSLHAIPETGTQLPKTRAYLEQCLTAIGIPFVRNQADSGIIAIMKTPLPGKTIAFRTDMDALPITEETMLPFAAANGNMHACGHDAHMAILLGTIELLWQQRANLSGCFLFLFQTGEETSEGARLMCAEPIFQNYHPDCIFGLHVGRLHPDIAHGQLGISPGICMASYDKFIIQIQGKGTHGSTPELGIDPLYISSVIVQNLPSILGREHSALHPGVISVGKITGGDTYNIIPDSCTMEGTFRSLDNATRTFLADRISGLADGIAAAFHATVRTQIIWGAAPLCNTPSLTKQVQQIALQTFSPEEVITDLSPIMVGEDFATYLEHIPGTYCFLGTNPPEGTPAYPHHNSRFDIDDSVLWKGAVLFYQIAKSYSDGNI